MVSTASPISGSSCRRLRLAAFPTRKFSSCPGCFRTLPRARSVYTNLIKSGVLRDYGDYRPDRDVGDAALQPALQFSASHPIKDLKGKKVRGSGVIQIESLKALGAVPVGMPPTEVPEAIGPAHYRCRDLAAGRFVRFRPRPRHQPSLLHPARGRSAGGRHEPQEVRKRFPRRRRMRSVSHSLDWINKLYDDSMLEYDQSLIDRLKVGSRSEPSYFQMPPIRRRLALRLSPSSRHGLRSGRKTPNCTRRQTAKSKQIARRSDADDAQRKRAALAATRPISVDG